MPGWWSRKIRRTSSYLRATVSAAERDELATWLTPDQLRLFDSMNRADRRHGLDVIAYLRGHGATDLDLLVAGLVHDSGKGRRVRLVHRVTFTLGQRYGSWVWRISSHLPTFRTGLAIMRDHAALSAELAKAAGCSPRAIALIRNQENPTDDDGRLLLEADEAN